MQILIAADRPANLRALDAILPPPLYHLVKAASSDEALRAVGEIEFVAVVLDMGDAGLQTARLIRDQPRSRHTPIIFFTAPDWSDLTVEEAYALGAVDCLAKPILPVILRAKLAGFAELAQRAVWIERQAEQIRAMERRAFEAVLAEESARLKASQQCFTRFMQQLPGLAWIKDMDGRYVYANEAALKAFAASADQVLGKTDEEIFPPLVASQFKENDRRAAASPAGIQVVESLEHSDGSMHQSVVSKFLIPGLDGESPLLGGMAIDITDRLRAEEALREADRRKDGFLAMLAHELRNPLAPVRNALQLMKMPGVQSRDLVQAREMIERQVEHLVRLVDDLVDLGRIIRGRMELRKERVELAKILASAAENVQPTIDAHGHELHVSVPDRPVWLDGDPVRLAQLVANLLHNASKYSDKAGRIDLVGERDGGDAVIRVRDTGIGIGPELLPRIFEPFTQADRSLARTEGGLGIGLTIVRRLVEMHGGSVTANSGGPGLGSEFVVRLPASPHGPLSRLPNATTCEASFLPRRIIVVDDNVDAAESTAMYLRLLGHQVRVFYDGRAVLDAVAAFRPEIVLLDIGLPGLNGFEVAAALRAAPQYAALKIVAVTGYGQPQDLRRSQEAGFDHHLIKPVEPAALAALVQAAEPQTDRSGPAG